jgi:hypothetical protein
MVVDLTDRCGQPGRCWRSGIGWFRRFRQGCQRGGLCDQNGPWWCSNHGHGDGLDCRFGFRRGNQNVAQPLRFGFHLSFTSTVRCVTRRLNRASTPRNNVTQRVVLIRLQTCCVHRRCTLVTVKKRCSLTSRLPRQHLTIRSGWIPRHRPGLHSASWISDRYRTHHTITIKKDPQPLTATPAQESSSKS